MFELVAALAVFVASHSLTNIGAVRRPAERALGRRGFIAAYSLLSLLLLAWVIAAFAAAPVVVVWPQEPWMRLVPLLAMPLASVLVFAGLTAPNPFSIGPGGRGFDPDRPGVLRLTRHPVLWGLGLWAGAHLLPNGEVAALLLFVPLLAMAAAGPALLDAKRRRLLGADWPRLAQRTGGGLACDWAALVREAGPLRLAGGLGLYALLLALHQPVIGITPLP